MKKFLVLLIISMVFIPFDNIFAYDVDKQIKANEEQCLLYDKIIKEHEENIAKIQNSSDKDEEKSSKITYQKTRIIKNLQAKCNCKRVIRALLLSNKPDAGNQTGTVEKQIREIETIIKNMEQILP